MDNSGNESEKQHLLISPRRRRRSTFFERRDSTAIQPPTEIRDEECDEKPEDSIRKQDLLRYYDALLSEKEQWKKEVNLRRNKYHDLKQQYQLAAKSSTRSRMCYSVLSKEDMEFLKAKVNISKLIESQQNLQKSVKTTQAFYRKALELDDVVLRNCEDRVNKITDYILDNSTVDSTSVNLYPS